MKKYLLVAISFFLAGSATVLAQGVTTASINGIIRDKKGGVLPGANVIAVHQPTGSQYGAAARVDGRFTIPNAKVGGPYKITVSFVGFEQQERDGIFLTLGNSTDVDFILTESGTQLQEIQVVTSKADVFNSDRTGASTNISNQEITRLPTISRSFNDYVRLTPQANANSFAGRSDGYNNITVDGALFNNAFGLSGTVGGQANAQPISLDAVDQITTSIAPFDVKEGSFTGAGINVVTRSGTNDVTGSVYYFFRNQNMAGSKVSGNKNPLTSFDFNNIGFRVGGPIIKNKLFFFVNFERERRNDPGTQFSASRGGSSGPTVSQVQGTDLDALKTFLVENYQYDPGPYEGYKLQSNSDKGTVKIDWNISTQHKFTIKYNFLNSYRDVPPSNSGSLGGTRNPSQTGLPFLGAYYRINNNLNSVIAELNSTFGNNFSNKFQVGYTAFRDFRETPTSSKLFPLVDIGNGAGSFLTAFGYEPFSAYNILNSNVFQLSDNFDIYKGKHTFTIGTYNEFYHFENGFDPFYYGAYQFNTLADFYASAAGTVGSVRQYQLGYSTAADGSFPLVKINAYQLGFYAQDKFDVNRNFSLTYGIRADIPTISSAIARNTQAAGYTFRDGQQVNTDQVQKTSVLWSPRVGFNWDVKGDKSTQVRGGSGVFTGRVPYVWISNQASNNGMLFGSQFYNQVGATAAGIVFQPDVDAYRPGKGTNPPITTGPATYNLAVTDQNFKFPQVWRTNVAIDQRLPGGLIGSLDIAFTQDINAVYHQNINLPNPAGTASGADNRPIFYKAFPNAGSNGTANTRLNPAVTDAILMRNTSKPYSYFITAQFKKSFGIGLDANVAYTYTQSKSVNDGGSIAQSVWRDRSISTDPNANALGYSNYLKPHRIIASVNYRKEYAGFMGTSIGLFYELSQTGNPSGFTQSRFSYVYSGDMNGDNAGGNNDLIYIPKSQSEIALTPITNSDATIYTAAQQWADLDAYINQDKYLSKHRGEYAERNGAIMPWRGQLDVRILQDFYVKAGGKRNTIQLSLDIFNVGNLVNSNWGVYKTYNRNNLITFRGYDAAGVPQFQYPYLNAATKTPLTSTFRDDLNLLSRWQMQLGLRYIFN
ncbi:MAG TPA: TonB-dependent receptor [Cyclobacteriaceae bacterium]|nr:TonB-dependent receptor [Cyclobacteriaceae bacterium]